MSEFEKAVFDITTRVATQALIEARTGDQPIAKLAAYAAVAISDEVERARRSRRSIAWDQRAVTEWQNRTFGEPRSNLGIAVRANEEMSELLRCLALDDNDPAARLEIADVVIVLCRLSERLGGTMVRDVDEKMAINANRTWKRRGDGHGHHMREPVANPRTEASTKEGLLKTGGPSCTRCGGTGVTSIPFEPTTMAPCECRK